MEALEVLTIARSFKHNFQYHLKNIHLEYVKEFNDLGLLINSSLTWRSHLATKISKTNRILGLIKCTVGFNAVKLHLYTTLVKPLFSCASIVYSCGKADINQIERIQRKATKYILNDYVSYYPTRLHNTKISPLSFIKDINDLCFLYKCIHSFIDIDIRHILSFSNADTSRTRLGQQVQL